MTPDLKGFVLVTVIKMLVVFTVTMVGVALLTLGRRAEARQAVQSALARAPGEPSLVELQRQIEINEGNAWPRDGPTL